MFSRFPLINLMNSACIEASRQLIRDFNELSFLKANRKIDQFLARTIDRTQDIMQEILIKSNLSHGMVFEGKIVKPSGTGVYWLINALDNKENFLHRLPFFGITLALIKNNFPIAPKIEENDLQNENSQKQIILKPDFANHEIMASMLFDPMKNETFWAMKDSGTFLASKKLTIQPSDANVKKLFAGNLAKCNRNFGSNVMHAAYLTAGRLDEVNGEIDEITNLYASKLFIEEAKGFFELRSNMFVAKSY